MLVCGNSASMTGESWLGQHFEIHGNRDVHYGLFDCSPVTVTDGSGGAGGCC
jgi:arsenite methyltransferase